MVNKLFLTSDHDIVAANCFAWRLVLFGATMMIHVEIIFTTPVPIRADHLVVFERDFSTIVIQNEIIFLVTR